MSKRAVVIVLDGLGAGELPDARLYNDEGSNTLGHILEKKPGIKIPNLSSLGLLKIISKKYPSKVNSPAAIKGSYGISAIRSTGKDTTTGHWELAGLLLDNVFPVYPDGFPKEIIERFERETGKKTIGNQPASGSEIIQDFGEQHCKTGSLIIYTSADSVFQVCAHEAIVPLEELYSYCRKAREILTGKHAVGRVIARPFLGTPGNYYRTMNRRDFSVPPIGETVLDSFSDNGISVYGVGKIGDIFAGRGIKKVCRTKSNAQGVEETISLMRDKKDRHFIFTNLIDFDMLYGHRNDWKGYAEAIEEFDRMLPDITDALGKDDVLFITADHGCDPTTLSTDHSREYVPLMVYGRHVKPGVDLGIRSSLNDMAATLSELYGIRKWHTGKSFLKDITV